MISKSAKVESTILRNWCSMKAAGPLRSINHPPTILLSLYWTVHLISLGFYSCKMLQKSEYATGPILQQSQRQSAKPSVASTKISSSSSSASTKKTRIPHRQYDSSNDEDSLPAEFYDIPGFVDIINKKQIKGGMALKTERFNDLKAAAKVCPKLLSLFTSSWISFPCPLQINDFLGPGIHDPRTAIGRHVANDYRFALDKSVAQTKVSQSILFPAISSIPLFMHPAHPFCLNSDIKLHSSYTTIIWSHNFYTEK